MDTEIICNVQKRNLGEHGWQKRVTVPKEEASGVCDVFCLEQSGMSRSEDNQQICSMQWTYELDDMCHGRK